MKNHTNERYYSVKQARFPVLIAESLEIRDPALAFDRIMEEIGIEKYAISSNNKTFRPNMGGYSIFGDSLDGTDCGVRLERYMAEEGTPGGWKVEDCCILERMRDAAAIPNSFRAEQEDGTVCYFFGDTTIRVEEDVEDGRLRLKPISGDQVGPDGWVDLEMDRVYGYCTLLERQLNGR